MQIEWTEDEVTEARSAWQSAGVDNVGCTAPELRAVMSRAVDLWQARASGQVAEDATALHGLMTELRAHRIVSGWHTAIDDALPGLFRLAALAQRTEDAEKERDEARGALQSRLAHERQHVQQFDALRAEVERLKERLSEASAVRRVLASTAEKLGGNLRAAESLLAAVRERCEARVEAGHRLRMAIVHKEPNRAWSSAKYEDRASEFAHWILEGDATNPSIPSKGSDDARLYVCSCHMPGGAQGCKADQHPCSDTCTHDDARTPGHPERVKERSEAYMHASEDDTVKQITGMLHDVRDAGAEAMRAACWEAVQQVLQRHGFTGEQVVDEFKAAIEGATP